jgi:peptidoglycan-associated lipoprotein
MTRARNATIFFALLALVVSAGCGKKNQEIKTDPGATELGTDLELGTENVPKDPFGGGEATEPQDVDVSDVDSEPAVMLRDVFFAFDQYDLDTQARTTLADNNRSLRDSNAHILIEGHCDERGTTQYNLALGEKRAQTAKGYLVSLGVDPGRVDIVSYGKERPFVMGHDESAWSQNRRAHFVVR